MVYKKIFLLSALFLSACISVGANEGQTPTAIAFVTATLVPTQVRFIPATLTPIPENTIAPTLNVTAPANCKNSAVLLQDVTIPDDTQVTAGKPFTKTWEFQNNGTCPWKDYTLAFSSGDQMSAPLSAPIADTAPKSKVQISVELTAPTADGSYTGYFTLNDAKGNAVPIGTEKTFWVKVVVGSGAAQTPNPNASITNTPFVPSNSNSNCAYTPNAGYVADLISLINQARTNAQLPALTVDARLTSAAQAHSADMACNNFHAHTGSDGSTIGDRLIRAGFASYNYFEIIAIGTPQAALEQWRADADHWDAVLSPNVSLMGVGYAYYSASDFGGYITVDFGKP
ncbi:MAG: hypothetical protein IT310_07080 [Anaerolineales bacterium]|nr:hypothetical protein [Anaerolineales bacterium]